MKTLTYFSVRRRFGFLLLALVLFAGSLRAASPVYSNIGNAQASGTCFTCTNGGVFNLSNAADTDLTNYATLYTSPLSTATTVWLRLPLGGTGLAGYRVGVLVASTGNLLNLSALGAVHLRTYLGASTAVVNDHLVDATLAQNVLLNTSTRPSQLEFTATAPFDRVELAIDGLVGVNYAMRVYYAYTLPALVQPEVTGVLSQFASSAGHFSTADSGLVCANTDVDNAAAAADNSLTNYASFSSLLTVACPQTLRVKLSGTAPAGYYAGFVLGSAGLLDAAALAGVRIRTYRNGQPQEAFTGAGLLRVQALPGGQAQVSFPSALPFDEVSIERVGLLTVLDNLRLYYGFGVEPKAFEATTVVQSNFPAPAASQYLISSTGVACATVVTDPLNAVDNQPNTFATLAVPACLGGETSLRLNLNGTGRAGDRAGFTIGTSGIIDVSLLSQLTVSTFDASNHLLESSNSSNLLQLNVLPNGRREVSFATTQPFASVQLSLRQGASLLNALEVYAAFADDRPRQFPLSIVPPTPLPVELTSLTAQWYQNAALLTWTTVSERSSSYFVLERAATGSEGFVPVGQVAAAGHSTTTLRYQWTDAGAATLGAAQLYYRLRQVDEDGRTSYSPTVVLKSGSQLSVPFQLYPNPATGSTVMLALPTLPARVTVQVYAESGHLVQAIPAASSEQPLPLTSLTNGLYLVVLRDALGQKIAAQRLLVAR